MGSEAADTARGKELFAANCASCHNLADAGSQQRTQGPDLDNAFRASREQGIEESTVREVVLQQIRFPVPPMPANLVKGEDAEAVAAYVASVAGTQAEGAPAGTTAGGGAQGGGADGKSIFASAGCGACHRLADAGSTGTTGPDLDEARPSLKNAVGQIRNGGSGMPAFKDQLSERQIRAVAEYVVRAARK